MVAINRNYQIIMANELFKNEFGMQPNDFCYKVWKNRKQKCEECLVEKTYRDGWGHWNVENVTMKDGSVANMLVKANTFRMSSSTIRTFLPCRASFLSNMRFNIFCWTAGCRAARARGRRSPASPGCPSRWPRTPPRACRRNRRVRWPLAAGSAVAPRGAR